MFDRKGVAPVLATVLIVLIVIFLAGGLFVYLNQTQSAVEEETSEQIREFGEATSYRYQIVSLNCDRVAGNDTVVVRNTGSNDIETTNINVLHNGDTVTMSEWDPSETVNENDLTTGTFPSGNDLESGDTVRVLIGESTQSAVCQ